MPRRGTESAPDQLCPIAVEKTTEGLWKEKACMTHYLHGDQTIIDHDLLGQAVDGEKERSRRSWDTHKSAPIVALYWLLNRLLTYWFISDVLPTLGGMMR